MRVRVFLATTILLSALVLTGPPAARAQGCTLGLPASYELAINNLLLNACGRHDTCWRTRNPCGGPYLGLGWKATCDLQFLADLTGVCAVATALFSFPNQDFDSIADFAEACEAGATAAYLGVSANIFTWRRTQCRNGCNLQACNNGGGTFPSWCCPSPPPSFCDCNRDSDCDYLPPPEWGTWECIGCTCVLTNSPLVLHLPDYLPADKKDRGNWWKQGFCGDDAPTVCLDWRGDGSISCTAWTAPDSDVAFVVSLSADDLLRLVHGASIATEPWRHFFGNVTQSADGKFPFAHGFQALASHCEQDPQAEAKIDLTQCGSSLHVWADRNSDGRIAAEEILEFQDLGIEALGTVRQTGKADKCGNTFPAESHATCFDSGTCGTWLDVFFESRSPGSDLLAFD